MKQQVSGMTYAGVARRVNALFKAMAGDFLLREQFVTDPTQVLSEYVRGERVPPESASISNQLLYAVMSNRRMRRWLQDYVNRHGSRHHSHREFVENFGRAAANHGGQSIVFSLLRASIEADGTAAFENFEWTLQSLMTIIRPRPDITGTGTTGTGTTGTGTTGTGTTGTGTTGTGTTGTGTTGTGTTGTGTSGIYGITGAAGQPDTLDLPDYARVTFIELVQFAITQQDIGVFTSAL
jgi:hypothetical protein